MKYVWEYISTDGLELPIYIADTSDELAKLIGGITGKSIVKQYYRYMRGTSPNCRYRRIQIDYYEHEDEIVVQCPYCNASYALDMENINSILKNKQITHRCRRCKKEYNIVKYKDNYIGI